MPHNSTQELRFRDWKIPKGTTASANLWCVAFYDLSLPHPDDQSSNTMCRRQMTRDERFFPDPEVFRPERHEAKYNSKESVSTGHGQDDPSAIIFGFGRRYVRDLSRDHQTAHRWLLFLYVSPEYAPVKHSQTLLSSKCSHACSPYSTFSLIQIQSRARWSCLSRHLRMTWSGEYIYDGLLSAAKR